MKLKNKIKNTSRFALIAILLVTALYIGIHYFGLIADIEASYTPLGYNKEVLARESELTMRENVWNLAESRDWKKEDIISLMIVLDCESNFNEYAIGINRDGSKDLGIAQWNEKWHSEIGRECSFNWECAINEMINTVNKDGDFGQWVCSNRL